MYDYPCYFACMSIHASKKKKNEKKNSHIYINCEERRQGERTELSILFISVCAEPDDKLQMTFICVNVITFAESALKMYIVKGLFIFEMKSGSFCAR